MSSCSNSEPYALQVLGDSMAPEFDDGVIVIVEPGAPLEDGCYVIADCEGETFLRQLTRNGNGWLLQPLNPAYPDLPLEHLEQVRGRVIQRCGKRRREHKYYDQFE